LVRNRTGPSAQPEEQTRNAEESGKEREEDRVWSDEARPSEDRDPEAGGQCLDPHRPSQPADAVPSARFGSEDGRQDEHQERRGPRSEEVREVNRICQEEPQWDQGDDRERGSQQCAAGGERDRFRALADQEETVPGKGGESRIFRRRPRNTAGMKSKTAWLPAAARRKQDSRRPIVSGSDATSGTRVATKLVHAACVARTRAATLLT